MRPVFVAIGLAMFVLSVGLLGGASPAAASTGTLKFTPVPRLTAWNADAFSIEVAAQSVDVTTQCLTDPNNENSPTADCGVGAFEVTLAWDPARLTFLGAGPGTWLTSTGRPTPFCFPPETGTGTVTFKCVTFGATPMGPQGSGSLATFSFDPNGTGPQTTTPITMTAGTLADIAGQPFPVTLLPGTIEFGFCTDVADPPDNTVDLSDAVVILQQFGGNVPPTPQKYDPTRDNTVDLSDAIYALQEFGQSCVA